MKSLIILLFAAGLFSSCQKKHCWECTGSYNNNEIKYEVCDKTRAEISVLESEGVYNCKKK